jgi:hypothetical protein
MCSQKEKTIVHNLNRLIIASTGVVGVLLDGFSSGDIFYFISLLVWILQPECNAIEEKLLDKLHTRRSS